MACGNWKGARYWVFGIVHRVLAKEQRYCSNTKHSSHISQPTWTVHVWRPHLALSSTFHVINKVFPRSSSVNVEAPSAKTYRVEWVLARSAIQMNNKIRSTDERQNQENMVLEIADEERRQTDAPRVNPTLLEAFLEDKLLFLVHILRVNS